MELGLTILEFARNAYPLFIQMEPLQQAKLLRVVLSKCELQDGKLTPTYKKPFDLIANMSDFEKNWTRLDDFRTFLIENPEVVRILLSQAA